MMLDDDMCDSKSEEVTSSSQPVRLLTQKTTTGTKRLCNINISIHNCMTSPDPLVREKKDMQLHTCSGRGKIP